MALNSLLKSLSNFVNSMESNTHPHPLGIPKSVQTIKRLMIKAVRDGEDVHVSLLDYRNTFIAGDISLA